MNKYADDSSYVIVYAGGRGSGKTMSMSVQASMDMAQGKRVWSNYDLHPVFGHNGKYYPFKGERIEIEDLITFRDDIRGGVICLDELNLWASARGHMAILNRLLNSWVQLIRHRLLNVYITIQTWNSLDIGLRNQTDLLVECMDMHHLYNNIPKGHLIRQERTDISGMFTGHPLYKSGYMGGPAAYWDQYRRNTQVVLMKASPFFGVYDSWSEHDILAALTKYQVNVDTRVISRDDEGNARVSSPAEIEGKIQGMVEDLKTQYPQGVVFTRDDMANMMRDYDIETSWRHLNSRLDALGWERNNGGYSFGE